jgi:S1-C subfamily serine protease
MVGVVVLAMAAAAASGAAPAAGTDAGEPPTPARPPVIDDAQFLKTLETEGVKLIEAGRTVPSADLIKQLDRAWCNVRLPKPAARALSATELYERCRESVVAVAGLFTCEKCGKKHWSVASGFLITESGAAVTSYHVVNDPKNLTLVAATADGKVWPVRSVLAASAAYDVAIVQVESTGLKPLAIVPHTPVGSDVFVISHPDNRFFTLTRGIVSRYGTVAREHRRVPMLQITAEFAKGSSGAPVLNSTGNVVGLVSSTVSVYYAKDHDKQENLQMVLNQCVPADQVLELIKAR